MRPRAARSASGATIGTLAGHQGDCEYIGGIGECTCQILLAARPSDDDEALEEAYREYYDPDWGSE